MNTNSKTSKMQDMQARLSTLWIVVMFNMLAADILGMHIGLFDIPATVAEMAEFAGNTPITQLMFIAAIIMELPIAMIFLSRILKYRANRWANIIAVVITSVFVIGGGSTDPHYIFFAAMEIVSMLLIVWYVWKWPAQEA